MKLIDYKAKKIITISSGNSYAISTNYADRYTHYIELSLQQIGFLEAHPLATMDEIWNMQLSEQTDETEAIDRNTLISKEREKQYKYRSDSLYMAYQKYIALGETEKAEIARTAWLAEVAKIEAEFPYDEE